MTILYIHQYFKTPETGPCRSWFIAKSMVENGHKVVLISGHNKKERLTENINGIEVRYIPNLYKNEFGFYRRALSFFSFLLKAFSESLKIKADLVYASSTPLTVGGIALLLFKLKKKPYIFEVRDVWPKAPIELGYINHAWPQKLLFRLEKKIYKHAQKIVALSPPMAEHVRQITPGKQVMVIPNMSDLSLFNPVFPSVQKELHVVYAGSLGDSNNPKHLLNLAFYAEKNQLPYFFHVAGEGKYTSLFQDKEIKNLKFYGNLSRAGLKDLYDKAHISLINFRKHPVLDYNSPNKLFEGLAAGKVIALNSAGWTKTLVEDNNCGFYYDSAKPENFFFQAEKEKNELAEMAQNARRLAENEFSTSLLCKKLLSFLEL